MNDDALTIGEFEALIGGRVESIQPIGEPMITREFLQTEINSLQQQRANAQQAMKNAEAVMHGAEGAIQAYSALLSKMEAGSPPETTGSDEPFKEYDNPAFVKRPKRNGAAAEPEMTGATG